MPDIYVAFDKLKAQDSKDAKVNGPSQPWWQEIIHRVLSESGEKPGRSVAGAYCVYPGSRFITQQQDEEIVLLLRAHPVTLLPWMLLALFMLLLPSLILSTGAFADVPGKFIFVARLVWYLMTLMYAFEKFLYWFYSVFIVTNERLVDIDFENLITREITYANLNHIEEPAMISRGIFRSIFHFGDVLVTTASEMPTVEGLAVPYPDKVVEIISRLSEELEKRRERGE